MRLDGFGILVKDMATMIRFYRDVLGFEIKETEDSSNVYLVKDGTLRTIPTTGSISHLMFTGSWYTTGNSMRNLK